MSKNQLEAMRSLAKDIKPYDLVKAFAVMEQDKLDEYAKKLDGNIVDFDDLGINWIITWYDGSGEPHQTGVKRIEGNTIIVEDDFTGDGEVKLTNDRTQETWALGEILDLLYGISD